MYHSNRVLYVTDHNNISRQATLRTVYSDVESHNSRTHIFIGMQMF